MTGPLQKFTWQDEVSLLTQRALRHDPGEYPNYPRETLYELLDLFADGKITLDEFKSQTIVATTAWCDAANEEKELQAAKKREEELETQGHAEWLQAKLNQPQDAPPFERFANCVEVGR